MVTKLNVNIRTLLTNCEELAKDDFNFWRLKKFIKSLDIMIEELRECDDFTSNECIPGYTQRLEALKTLTNYTDNSTVNKSRIVLRPTPPQEIGDNMLREINQLRNSKDQADLRNQLLSENTLRERKPERTNTPESFRDATKYYNETQEKLADHMLSLTRSLREQTETANRIIKYDTEIVHNSSNMTDTNTQSLHKESLKLDQHNRNAWRCGIWMMIMFVIVVFIGMVLFMKVVKKKKL